MVTVSFFFIWILKHFIPSCAWNKKNIVLYSFVLNLRMCQTWQRWMQKNVLQDWSVLLTAFEIRNMKKFIVLKFPNYKGGSINTGNKSIHPHPCIHRKIPLKYYANSWHHSHVCILFHWMPNASIPIRKKYEVKACCSFFYSLKSVSAGIFSSFAEQMKITVSDPGRVFQNLPAKNLKCGGGWY